LRLPNLIRAGQTTRSWSCVSPGTHERGCQAGVIPGQCAVEQLWWRQAWWDNHPVARHPGAVGRTCSPVAGTRLGWHLLTRRGRSGVP